MPARPGYSNNVFINCPFDTDYQPIYEAIVFAIVDCGFTPRCALEENDGGNVRMDKIIHLIDECKYGIHDLSKADLDVNTHLARFNMPFELGLFLGARRFASAQHYNKDKKLLIMDSDKDRYSQFISDLSGHDISAHNQDANSAIVAVRDFLANQTRRVTIAGGAFISQHYQKFLAALPDYCNKLHWDRNHLQFLELVSCAEVWIEDNPI